MTFVTMLSNYIVSHVKMTHQHHKNLAEHYQCWILILLPNLPPPPNKNTGHTWEMNPGPLWLSAV